MRLINTRTLELETFRNAEERPPYAILSHRWVGDEEVTFQDMQQPHRKWMPGWQKIRFCCAQAHAEGLHYAWVDTCCINKDSSAELSEAINSMYDWYSRAAICYAYLNDVDKPQPEPSIVRLADLVANSTWFLRAWTLQELISPGEVIFFGANFARLGTKRDFASSIEAVTRIPADLLLDPWQLSKYPTALRMSWAAGRVATRTEDIAYSLFGLFQVNLPLLYGEGMRAFIRLQEEIIRNSHDHTIFLWQHESPYHVNNLLQPKRLPVLAPSPKYFATCQDIVKLGDVETKAYAMTNVGLQIELPLFPYHLDVYVAFLDCRSGTDGGRYGILLARDPTSRSKWHRTSFEGRDVIRIPGRNPYKDSAWRRIDIIRDVHDIHLSPTSLKRKNKDGEQAPSVFYGIKINASSFLKWPAGGIQPYSLVAYHDWKTTEASAIVNPGQQQNQPSERPRGNSLLSPSSFKHISHFHAQVVPFNEFEQAGLKSIPQKATAKRLRIDNGASNSTQFHVDEDQEKLLQRSPSKQPFGTFEMPVLSAGTCGVIVFDNVVHGLHALKIGFDFDFRPVVYLATHEAGKDSDIENWMRQWRFKHVDAFESSLYLQAELDHDDVRHFWKLHPDMMKSWTDEAGSTTDGGDAPVELYKGIYGLRSSSLSNTDYWTFKPYRDEHWHLALKLEKLVREGELCWELTMHREDEMFELNVELSHVV